VTDTNGYRVEVDWAPAFELVVSLAAYSQSRIHKALDLGPRWATRVRRLIGPELADRIKGLSDAGRPGESFLNPDLLVWKCPAARDVEGFLAWLGGLTAGEVYELVAPHLPEGSPALRDLGEAKDQTVRLLEAWNERYFRQVDPALLERLAAEARTLGERPARSASAADRSAFAVDLVEEMTGGVRFENAPACRLVVLSPQHHFSPLNCFGPYRDMVIISYPADVLAAPPGEPPAGLVRLAQAVGDPSRLRILRFVSEGPEKSFTDIVRFSGLAKSTVHHHLLVLRSAGLLHVHTSLLMGPPGAGDRYSFRPTALDSLRQSLSEYLGGKR